MVDIRFSGSAWQPQVPRFSVLAGPEPEQPLPWINLDRIDVVLSEHAQVELDSLTLVGVTVPQYAPSRFQYDSDSFTATWEFSTPFPADKLLLDLPDQWINASPMVGPGAQTSQVSADRFAFPMRVDILPGDSNRDRQVDIADLVNIATRVPSSIDPSPSPKYGAQFDVNADGLIDIGDLVNVASRVPTQLPDGEPTLPTTQ